MVGHGLSIAKASLLAACLRPDVTKVSRDDVNSFHDKLQLTITRCVPSNVQTSKTWLLEHIIPSAARSAAFGKYLLSVSKHLGEDEALTAGLEICRLQLHILYILNDLLHHVKHHIQNSSFLTNLVQGTIPALANLFQYPAAARKSRTLKRLHNLLDIWGQEQYYEKQTLEHIRQNLTSNKAVQTSEVPGIPKPVDSKELAWSLPATHGDSSAPYFDLPAANLMPHIIPNSSTPIRPDQVRALHLSSGSADESLVNAVKDFLKDVEAIDNPYEILDVEGIDVQMDELGQLSYRNETGDLMGDTYYGWSRAFCEKMKKGETEEQQTVRNRSPSYGRSRNSSRSPRKRPRYSSSRSRSRSYSRSRSPRRFDRGDAKSGERGTNRSRSYSPKRSTLSERPSAYQPLINKPPNMPFPLPSVGLEGFPIPPPMPGNWQGPWPPPPPPPPPGPSFNGSNHLPFPPPPNLQSHPRDSSQHQFNSRMTDRKGNR